jgi:hypothetical protein
MSTAVCDVTTRTALWSPADTLSPRVRRLRDHYWDFYNRDYTNEARAFTTGTPWDQVYAPWNWTNVPEMMMFFTGAKAYLLADATQVELSPGFWDEPLVVRRAIFFRRVLEEYLPVQILAGEKDPDAYRNLLVRVTGYNAYFVMLGREIQDEIIARESHAL